jgi:hypothetical protein
MDVMRETVRSGRQPESIWHYRDLADQASLYQLREPAFQPGGIQIPDRRRANKTVRRILFSTGGPGKPPEGSGSGGSSGSSGGGSGNSGDGSKPKGPRDLATPVEYGETGGGTGADSNSQPSANAGVVGAHGGTDAAAGATPAGTAGSMERAPAGSDTGNNTGQAKAADKSGAPLSPPGRDQRKPDSPIFGDKSDAAAPATDAAASPAAGAGVAGGTGLGEAARADNTRNDTSTTGATGVTGSGTSDAGRS